MAYTAISQLGYGNLDADNQQAFVKNLTDDGLEKLVGHSISLKKPENKQNLINAIGKERYDATIKEFDDKLDAWLNLYLCNVIGYDKEYVKDLKKLVLENPQTTEILLKLVAPFAKRLYWTMPDAKRAEVDHKIALPAYKAKWGIDWNKN